MLKNTSLLTRIHHVCQIRFVALPLSGRQVGCIVDHTIVILLLRRSIVWLLPLPTRLLLMVIATIRYRQYRRATVKNCATMTALLRLLQHAILRYEVNTRITCVGDVHASEYN